MNAKPHSSQAPASLVVGVDGSPGSVQALRWAARQAARGGHRLDVIHVWEYLPPAISTSLGWTFKDWPAEMAAAQRRLLFSLQKVFGEVAHGEGTWTVNGLTVHAELREGSVGPVLCAAAREASQLVVGARGHSRAVGMLLGSVSQYVTAHAGCPVTVVRDAEDLAALVGPGAAEDALATGGGEVGAGTRR
jgi:nucleotide-binding universal stress UspA family protein